MPDPLSALLRLPELQKQDRGLTDTPREIQQQPATWRDTCLRLHAALPTILTFLEQCGISPRSTRLPDVILAGAGTSDYIGRALGLLLQQHWGCTVRAIPSTTLLTSFDDFVRPASTCLLISFSRSGESSEGVALIRMALERYPKQVRHLVITCNQAGAMASLPGVFPIVLSDDVNDRGLAMTSSFTNMLVAGQFLAYLRDPDEYGAIVNSLASMATSLLPRAATLAADLAEHLVERVCFLGSGALQAVAQESSLKVLELNGGKIATIAESFLGLRHGPMAFLNQQTLVCAFLSGGETTLAYELDLLEEIRRKRLVKTLLIVTPHCSQRLRDLTGHILELHAPAQFPDSCRPPLDILVGQLLGLFLSIENGIRPDTPSTGAITRVVSQVNIYPPK